LLVLHQQVVEIVLLWEHKLYGFKTFLKYIQLCTFVAE